ncbi:MAG: hypothetical protein C4326_06090 [Ignavibacteria bacterium]
MKTLMIVLLLGISHAHAAFERAAHGARGTAMGGVPIALADNEWAAFVNPAALRTINERTVALFYAPRPFELKELAFIAAAYVEPTSVGCFGVAASRFGFELYRETRLAISFVEEITSGLCLGVGVTHYALSIADYGSASSLGVDVGMLMDVSDTFRWGVAASNLNAATIGQAKEKLPQQFATGVAFMPMTNATLTLSLSKDVRYPMEVRVGVEFVPVEALALRAGTSSDPSTLNAGFGVRLAFASFDYAFSSHGELGMTHAFSVLLRLGAW